MNWYLVYLLLVAHIVADFHLQCNKSCKNKYEKGLCGKSIYIHGVAVFLLTWLASWNLEFWWCALIVALTHFGLDLLKSSIERRQHEEKPIKDGPFEIWVFLADQLAHIGIIIGIVAIWMLYDGTGTISSSWLESVWDKRLAILLGGLFLMTPSNILIKLLFQRFTIDPQKNRKHISQEQNLKSDQIDENHGTFKSGALIGTMERLIILLFVIIGQYEAIGLLVAAKSILRFKEMNEPEQSEYVLVGTLISILLALGVGIIVI